MSSPRQSRPVTWLAAAMMLGSLSPWASLLGLATASGLQLGYGWITLLAGAGILTLGLDPAWLRRFAALNRRRALLSVVLAVISMLVCVLVLIGVGDTGYGTAVHASWGVYLTLAAAGAAAWNARGAQT